VSEFSSDLFFAFHISFRFLSQVYLEIPDEKFIKKVFGDNLLFEWPVAENQKTVSKGLKILQDYSSQWNPVLMEALKQDYTRLFIGLEKILAPPYASVYLSEEHLLFEKPTFDVRRFYEKLSLSVNPQKKEPDDHIGFELFCLSFLCEQANQIALIEFLSGHLIPWLNSFLSRVLDKAQTPFYRGISYLTWGLVESLSAFLEIEDTKF